MIPVPTAKTAAHKAKEAAEAKARATADAAAAVTYVLPQAVERKSLCLRYASPAVLRARFPDLVVLALPHSAVLIRINNHNLTLSIRLLNFPCCSRMLPASACLPFRCARAAFLSGQHRQA